MKKSKFSLLCLMFLSALNLNAEVGTLTGIVDGDTVYFYSQDLKNEEVKSFRKGNATITYNAICRFANIDTPESKINDRLLRFLDKSCTGITAEYMTEAGKESARQLSTFLEVGQQYKFKITGTDKYSRKICDISLDSNHTVNLEMVKSGYALPFYSYLKSNDRSDYIKAYNDAKYYKRGLFTTHEPVMDCMQKDLED